jgi:hypothetical protein
MNKEYRGIFSKEKFNLDMYYFERTPKWVEVCDGKLVDNAGSVIGSDGVNYKSLECWEEPIKVEEEITRDSLRDSLFGDLLFFKDFLCYFESTEYIKIIDEKKNKVYYDGRVEDLPCHDLFEKAKNMWVYGKVVLIKPILLSVDKVGKMGLTVQIDTSSILDLDE